MSIGKDPGAPVDLYEILQAAGEPELIDREVLGAAGLRLERWIDDRRRWLVATPA